MADVNPGDKVGEYILEERIGRGTFGEVWRARHAVLRKVAAAKIPTDPDYIRNLRTEGVIQHEIDSPHVVKTLGIDLWHDPPYLLTEYVDGQNLRALLRDGTPLAVETAVHYARQILVALAAAHAAGVIHRDLKPENILIDGDGTLKVTDFGLGRVDEATMTSLIQSGSASTASGHGIAGTFLYMAPEQLNGDAVDHRADLYAFGVVLFEMLTGMRPTGSDVPSDIKPDVPAHLDQVFRRCHCHVVRRNTSAAVLRAALDIRGEQTTNAREASAGATQDRVARGKRAVSPSSQVSRSTATIFCAGCGITLLGQPLTDEQGRGWCANCSNARRTRPIPTTASRPPRSLENEILTMLTTWGKALPNFFVHPNIPATKLANARRCCGVPDNVRVLALLDCTLFGSAKNAFLFCSDAIYYHNGWYTRLPFDTWPDPGHIPYSVFPSREFSNVPKTDQADPVSLGQGMLFWPTGVTNADFIAVLYTVKEMVVRFQK